MNRDTVFINEGVEQGPRAKRVKRNGSGVPAQTSFRFKEYQIPTKLAKNAGGGAKATLDSAKGTAPAIHMSAGTGNSVLAESLDRGNMELNSVATKPSKTLNSSSAAKSAGKGRRAPGQLTFKAYAPPGQPKPPPKGWTASPPTPVLPEPKQNSPKPLTSHVRPSELAPSESSQGHEVNVAIIPNDPVELAWWMAHQISHLEIPDISDSKSEDAHGDSFAMRQWLDRSSPSSTKPDSRHKQEKARKRQQRWRANHRERKNLNDLRSRINREAKIRFGPDSSPGKTAWIEFELVKRRNKLEAKQRTQAAESGKFPDFSISEDARASILAGGPPLSADQDNLQNHVVDLLFARGTTITNAQLMKAARATQDALHRHPGDRTKFLQPVFWKIAASPEASNSIRVGLGQDEGDSDEPTTPEDTRKSSTQHDKATQGAEETRSRRRSERTSTSRMANNDEEASGSSSDLMKVINDAVAILARINDVAAKAPASVRSRKEKKPSKTAQRASSSVIDLDAFLFTANAGPVSGGDDEDSDTSDSDGDETISDVPDLPNGKRRSLDTSTGSDSDIWNTINHIIDQLVHKRVAYDAEHRKKSSFDAHDQAQKARKLLADADLRTNFAMTKAKSEAISHLYTKLVGLLHAESALLEEAPVVTPPSPASAPPPPSSRRRRRRQKANAETSPSATAQEKILTEEEAARAFESSVTLPDPLSMPPLMGDKYKVSILSPFGHSAARTEEEQRKIQSYGYPPLPGSKVGTPRR